MRTGHNPSNAERRGKRCWSAGHAGITIAIVGTAILGRADAAPDAAGTALCDPKALARAAPQNGYAPIGDHCEGLASGDVAGGLDLLSVTLGSVRPDPSGALTLRAPLVRAPVRIVGTTLSSTVNYRVDYIVPIGGAVTWSTARLVRTTGASPREVGFLGYPSEALPQQVTPICAAPSEVRCDQERRIVVRVRTATQVSGLSVQVFRKGAGAVVVWQPVKRVELAPAGAPAGLIIPLEVLRGAGDAAFNVQFRAARPGGGPDLSATVTIVGG